jgi:hypothetical protein
VLQPEDVKSGFGWLAIALIWAFVIGLLMDLWRYFS